MHASNGFFAGKGGFEFPAVLGTSAAALALTGPGTLSLDHALGHRLNQPWMRTIALVAVIPAAAAVIARRRRLASTQAEPEPAASRADADAVAGSEARETA
jgi:putative oxidoreductase